MQRYAITGGASKAQVEAWVEAGVEWIQLREPGLAQPELERLAASLAEICRTALKPTCLLINGLDAASSLRLGACGIHLRSGAHPAQIEAARAAGARVTVSCHTLAEVGQACEGGADALLWAPVFGKTIGGTTVVVGSGLDAMAAACRQAQPTPVFALGGVTPQNAQQCVRAGAAGVAGIRLFAQEQWRAL